MLRLKYVLACSGNIRNQCGPKRKLAAGLMKIKLQALNALFFVSPSWLQFTLIGVSFKGKLSLFSSQFVNLRNSRKGLDKTKKAKRNKN